MQEENKTSGITVLSRRNRKVNIAMLYEHIRNTVIVNNRILTLFISLTKKIDSFIKTSCGVWIWIWIWENEVKWNLLVDEFGEEALSFNGGDVAAVVTPDEDAAFDVEEEQSRSCPWHWWCVQTLDRIQFESASRWWWKKKTTENRDSSDAVSTTRKQVIKAFSDFKKLFIYQSVKKIIIVNFNFLLKKNQLSFYLYKELQLNPLKTL